MVLMDGFPVMRKKHCVVHLGVIRLAAIDSLFAEYMEYSFICWVAFIAANTIKTKNFFPVFVSGKDLCHQVDIDVFDYFLIGFHGLETIYPAIKSAYYDFGE